MMRWCFLSTCKSGATNPEVSSTHRLPSQEPYRSLWLCALNLQHLDLGEESLNNIRICAQHFAPEDFMICKSLLRNRNGTSRTVILNPRAVPSLLLEPHDGRDLQDRRADALTRSEELANEEQCRSTSFGSGISGVSTAASRNLEVVTESVTEEAPGESGLKIVSVSWCRQRPARALCSIGVSANISGTGCKWARERDARATQTEIHRPEYAATKTSSTQVSFSIKSLCNTGTQTEIEDFVGSSSKNVNDPDWTETEVRQGQCGTSAKRRRIIRR